MAVLRLVVVDCVKNEFVDRQTKEFIIYLDVVSEFTGNVRKTYKKLPKVPQKHYWYEKNGSESTILRVSIKGIDSKMDFHNFFKFFTQFSQIFSTIFAQFSKKINTKFPKIHLRGDDLKKNHYYTITWSKLVEIFLQKILSRKNW